MDVTELNLVDSLGQSRIKVKGSVKMYPSKAVLRKYNKVILPALYPVQNLHTPKSPMLNTTKIPSSILRAIGSFNSNFGPLVLCRVGFINLITPDRSYRGSTGQGLIEPLDTPFWPNLKLLLAKIDFEPRSPAQKKGMCMIWFDMVSSK